MRHNGTPAVNILSEVTEETLQPWKELSTSVLVPFLTYNQPMLECESMKIEALVTNKQKPDQMYLAEDDVVLVDPPLSLTINGAAKVNQEVMATMVFMNPVNVTLRNCSMTMSGSGLLPQEFTYRLPDLKPQSRFTVRFTLSPFKSGRKTLALDFDCSVFRNIKAWCDFDVLP
ncbi:protein-glutamine gamma-glutamyltransferase E-like [Takifugu rubripes]|uniref:protein-glutamine gamma-glutamyltransferase E-like n=1 Tax=Takifugu rubripes TaxID=31033 RepID=UPI001145824B|nr:protein-glutamine gamma-glutamyltransferase E-like [Takifugu rubripes]